VEAALSAYATGATVFVKGTGSSSAWADTESIGYMIANSP
jgi:hypothetical protein